MAGGDRAVREAHNLWDPAGGRNQPRGSLVHSPETTPMRNHQEPPKEGSVQSFPSEQRSHFLMGIPQTTPKYLIPSPSTLSHSRDALLSFKTQQFVFSLPTP